MQPRFILYAPNVHVGGGWVLLSDFIESQKGRIDFFVLDERIRPRMNLDQKNVLYIKNTLRSRFLGEFWLWRMTREKDTVFCFHGLPPLFSIRSRIVIFIQNRLLIEPSSLQNHPLKQRIRLGLERVWIRMFKNHCSRYIVQTPTMAKTLKHFINHLKSVSIVPFAPVIQYPNNTDEQSMNKSFDFIYIASGEIHKNHKNLIAAWCLLAEKNIKPSLALTINAKEFPAIISELEQAQSEFFVNIVNLGHLSHSKISHLYQIAQPTTALIFPSLTESFGLPLVEAMRHGLPILAPELDYVRDLVSPVETFDPYSPVSIARAVQRFLACPEPTCTMRSSDDLFQEVIQCVF